MQLHQLQYIVETDRLGSISRAAESLYLSQPNLSTTISELEKELGIRIFDRTNRGVVPTEEGAVFLSYAQSIVNQIANLEKMYQQDKKDAATLRLAWASPALQVPRQFINQLPPDVPVNINLMEGTHLDVIRTLVQKESDIGVIIIPESRRDEYERYAQNQNLVFEKIWEMESFILMSSLSPLAAESVITEKMLENEYIQMVYRPAGIYDLPGSTAPKTRSIRLMDRNIYFNDRATLLEILSACPYTYIISFIADPERMDRYQLIARPQSVDKTRYIKALMYHQRPLDQHMEWMIRYLKEMKDTSHPDWSSLAKSDHSETT